MNTDIAQQRTSQYDSLKIKTRDSKIKKELKKKKIILRFSSQYIDDTPLPNTNTLIILKCTFFAVNVSYELQ